jgi:small GTP-binding protein
VIPNGIDVSAEYVEDKVLVNTQPFQKSEPTSSQMYTEPPIEVIYTSSTLKTDTSTTSKFPRNQIINDKTLQSPSFTKVSTSSRPSRNTVLKLVVVGDVAVGKTALLEMFKRDYFPEIYHPTVFGAYVDVEIDGQFVELSLWDTAGQDDYEPLRSLSYSDAHVFLILYSIDTPTSLCNVEKKWMSELERNFRQGELPPVLLVGTKADLRHDSKIIEELKRYYETPITYEEGLKVANQINAVKHLECSPKVYEGVNEVFEQATRAALVFSQLSYKKRKKRRKCNECIIL